MLSNRSLLNGVDLEAEEPMLNTTPMKLLPKEKNNEKQDFVNDGSTTPPPSYDELEEPKASLKITRKNPGERETWDTKLDFLLSVIGFAVDLGNVWRFPYMCYRNGGGAFLIPYFIMYVFGGLPLFFMELALGQFQRCGCITVWRRICPMFKGIGYAICIVNTYVAFYYNTIMAWSLYYLFDAMRPNLPWMQCGNWSSSSCRTVEARINTSSVETWTLTNCTNVTAPDNPHENLQFRYDLLDINNTVISRLYNRTFFEVCHSVKQEKQKIYSSTEEYYFRKILSIQDSDGIGAIGAVRWEISVCLMAIFTIVYFSLWKGVKSSGKAVWITATLPYIVLFTLLFRGLFLEGSMTGIKYYLTPKWEVLKDVKVWNDAASQILFSLGPGFGVLLALSSYSKFRNNCYKDAILTSAINSATSFLAGFVVFSVLGHMASRLKLPMEDIASEGPGLVFVAYPEAIGTLKWPTLWAILFFIMLITLGLDSTFAGIESVITAVLDEWPRLRRKREIFVLCLIIYCFVGAIPTTTAGGFYVLNLLDAHGAPISLLFVVCCEGVALCWFYGQNRFCRDVEEMLGFQPGWFWRICWTIVSPLFLMGIFLLNCIYYEQRPVTYLGNVIHFPGWAVALGWFITLSSLLMVPLFVVVKFLQSKGTLRERWNQMITPEELPPHKREKQLLQIQMTVATEQ